MQGLRNGCRYLGHIWGEGISPFQAINGLVNLSALEECSAKTKMQGYQRGIPAKCGTIFDDGVGIQLLARKRIAQICMRFELCVLDAKGFAVLFNSFRNLPLQYESNAKVVVGIPIIWL